MHRKDTICFAQRSIRRYIIHHQIDNREKLLNAIHGKQAPIMNRNKIKVTSLDQAILLLDETLAAHPERDHDLLEEAVLSGKCRPHAIFGLIHPDCKEDVRDIDGEFSVPEIDIPEGSQADLAREIMGKLGSLKMLNPLDRILGLGVGPGTIVTSFGIPINFQADSTPAFTKPLAQVLREPAPDAQTSGEMPRMRERIAFIKDHTPKWIKIHLPDMQGPYNLLHAIIGNEALTAFYTDPVGYRELMTRITDFWIETLEYLRELIGPDRLTSRQKRLTRIAECSVNMIAPETYLEYILPYDLKIAKTFGPLEIHTCSGPHVFHATLDNLPEVRATEAGYGDGLTAGYTPVKEALDAIGDRPIILGIGQMLPRGEEYEFIARDFDLSKKHNRLSFHYTGMYWRAADRPFIRDLHTRLDAYWERLHDPHSADFPENADFDSARGSEPALLTKGGRA
jgi:hypothetical protein